MKRVGHLLGAVAELENLRLAFWKAARGKGDRPVVRAFRQNLAEELGRMGEGILRMDYPVGRYNRFVIHDPKERVIHAARFSERVLHHALMNVCEPLFERWLIDDTYACRQGKEESLRRKCYVRYMDDFGVWGRSAAELRELQRAIEAFLAAELYLRAKDSPYINRTSHGMDFLGCRVRPGYSELNARSRKRFRRQLRRYGKALAAGRWGEEAFQRHAQPLCAFAFQVRSWRFRHRALEDFGRRPYGLEPREPGRQLEQQREQLPVGEPEQEQPG